MKRFYHIAAALLLVATVGTPSVSQTGQSTYDPAEHSGSSKPPDGFLDSTLKRINSSDRNYGQCLSEDRNLLLAETLRNAYFWSNVVALSLLGCFFIIIVYQQKAQTRREWTTAEIVTELEQSLTRSREQLADASKKNGEFKDALAALKESVLRSPSVPPESSERTGPAAEKPRTTITQSAPPATPRTNPAKPTNGGSGRSAVGMTKSVRCGFSRPTRTSS
jgi:cytoskeletal protein RodZ